MPKQRFWRRFPSSKLHENLNMHPKIISLGKLKHSKTELLIMAKAELSDPLEKMSKH